MEDSFFESALGRSTHGFFPKLVGGVVNSSFSLLPSTFFTGVFWIRPYVGVQGGMPRMMVGLVNRPSKTQMATLKKCLWLRK
jgi:hypothetical protein